MSLLPTWAALGALLTALLLLLGSVRRRLVVRRRPPLMSSLFSFSKFLRDHPDYYPTITSQTINKLLPTCSSKNKVHPPRFDKFNKLVARLEICQKIYTTGFSGQKFYTLKRRKLRRFLLKKQQRKCINISYCISFFG